VQLGARLPSRIQPLAKVFGAAGRGPAPSHVVKNPGLALARQTTGERQVDALQEGARRAAAPSASGVLSTAGILEGVVFTGNQTLLLQHGLGRAFRSAMVVGPSTNAAYSIRRPSGITADLTVISVTSYASMTCDVVVW
jgi:hypothetical protein